MAWAGNGLAWCGVVWNGMEWCGMEWYGMVWYGVAWYGMGWNAQTPFWNETTQSRNRTRGRRERQRTGSIVPPPEHGRVARRVAALPQRCQLPGHRWRHTGVNRGEHAIRRRGVGRFMSGEGVLCVNHPARRGHLCDGPRERKGTGKSNPCVRVERWPARVCDLCNAGE